MVAENSLTIRHPNHTLTYQDVCQLAEQLDHDTPTRTVVLDLVAVDDTTTGALAKLILIRGARLRVGGDLEISGIHSRVQCLHEIRGLQGLLPCVPASNAGAVRTSRASTGTAAAVAPGKSGGQRNGRSAAAVAGLRAGMLGCIMLMAMLTGCMARPTIMNPERLANGLVIVLPGIDGRSGYNETACKSLCQDSVGLAVELYDWTTPLGAVFNQCAVDVNRRKAAELAGRIVNYRRQHPTSPVFLVGHSGGTAIAAWAAEALPEGVQIDGIIMLASSLSPDYDLAAALAHTNLGIINYYSSRDSVLLGIGTSMMGTMDRKNTEAAGKTGFRASPSDRPAGRGGLLQISWSQGMADLGNEGGHFGWMSQAFVELAVAPRLAHGSWAQAPVALQTDTSRGDGHEPSVPALAFRNP